MVTRFPGTLARERTNLLRTRRGASVAIPTSWTDRTEIRIETFDLRMDLRPFIFTSAVPGVQFLQSQAATPMKQNHLVPTPARFPVLAWLLFAVCALLGPLSNAAQAATVTTDQEDYAPFSIVYITGAGFQPGETVSNRVVQIAGPAPGTAYAPWEVGADADGNFTTEWLVFTDELTGTTLQLTATGLTSGSVATATFTDAQSWTLTIAPTTTEVCATKTYTLTATRTGTGNGNNLLGCVSVVIPTQFSGLASPTIVSEPATKNWTASLSGNTLRASANTAGDRLDQFEVVQFSIQATAPSATTGSPFTWTGAASSDEVGCSSANGPGFPAPSSGQPTVSVTPDLTNPTITCPANVTVQCAGDVPAADFAGGSASDNCGTATVTHVGDVITPGTCVNQFTIARAYKATDGAGNMATCTQTITVNDTIPPVITCPPDKQLQCGDSIAPSNTGNPTATDNCTAEATIFFIFTDAATPANCTGQAGIERTWTAIDECGNNSSCVQHITFVDATPPMLTKGSIDSCYASAAAAEAAAIAATSATDNCNGVVTKTASTVGTCSATITVTGTDACTNSSSVTYSTRIDNTPPVLTGCPAPTLTVQCLSDVPAAATVTANDNCDGDVTVNFSETMSGPDCNKTITRTWSTMDSCGNPASCTQTITVHDDTPPTLTKGSIDSCYASAAAAEAAAIAATSATDNCNGVVTKTASTVGTCSATITVTGADACTNSSSVTYSTRIDSTPPVITCPPDKQLQCGDSIAPSNTGNPTATDNCTAEATIFFIFTDAATPANCTGQAGIERTWTAIDECGNNSSCVQHITFVDSTPPTIGTVTCSSGPLPISSSVTITANFADSSCPQTHTVTFLWDDMTPTTTVSVAAGVTSASANHTYAAAGVCTIGVIVTDACGNSQTNLAAFQFVVIYDPNGGFVTGGGWITSPPGALVGTQLTGKANFGFVSKYQNGATTGETEFQFKAGDLNFHSTSYQWLVIAGPKAQYKGWGTINGTGNYDFLLTATDGQVNGGGGVDKFRIKIWYTNPMTSAITLIYDNAPGSDDIDASSTQAIGGGSIVIHK
jgi:hypothetical protein